MLLNEAHTTSLAAARLGRRRPGVLGDLIAKHTTVFDLDDQITALKAAAARIPDLDTDQNARTTAVRTALADGTIDKLDLLDTLGTSVHTEAEYTHTAQALRDLMSRMRLEQEAQLQAATSEICTALSTYVITTVKRLRNSPISKANIRTAADAITHGLAKEWTTYTSLRNAYLAAYQAVASMSHAGLIDNEYQVEDWALTRLANPEEVWPEYIASRAKLTDERAPWPIISRTTGRREPEDWLDWLVATPQAQPTLLHPDRFHDARTAITDKARALARETRTPANL